jgi:hypothetical protein
LQARDASSEIGNGIYLWAYEVGYAPTNLGS